MEKLVGRDIINPHAIGKKVNEIVDIINELAESSTPQENPSESGETQKGESIKKEEVLN